MLSMAASPTLPTLSRLVRRVDPRRSGARVTWVIAPAGYGKSALLAEVATTAATTGQPAALVSVAQCEGHLGLFLDELARALRRAHPDADVRPLLSGAGGVHGETWLSEALDTVLDGSELVLLLDEVHVLAHGEPLTRLVAGLVTAPPSGVSLVLAARERPALGELTGTHVGRAELELTVDEVHEVLAARVIGADDELSRRVWEQTRGWPAVVLLIAAAASAPDTARGLIERLAEGDGELVGEVVDHMLAGLRPEVRYFASVAALLEQFDEYFMSSLFGAAVPGTPDERRRLIRLPPQALSDAITKLSQKQLLSRVGDGWTLDPVCRASLRDGFRRRDPEGYREAHRRAAELLIGRGDHGIRAACDHLVHAGAYERLLELLESHAQGLLERGEHRRLGPWLEALVQHYTTPPFWVDYYYGCVLARRGDWDGARAHLDDARAYVDAARGPEDSGWNGDGGTALATRWQPRLATAYADLMWRRGSLVEARTWAQRGIDFLDQLARRGRLPDEAQREASQALVQLTAQIGRTAMDAGSADKAREALEDALERARALGESQWEARILADLAANATRAARISACETYAGAGLKAVGESSPELRARILAALAIARLQIGDVGGATSRAAEALSLARWAGEPAGQAVAELTMARLEQARGDLGRAREGLSRAVAQAGLAAQVNLLGEALDRLAIATVRQDPTAAAEASQDLASAEKHLAPVLRLDGYLCALHKEATAEIRLVRDSSSKNALLYLEAARDGYDRFGANYDVARLHWREAEIHHEAATEGDDSAREDAVAQLEDACVVLHDHALVLENDEARRVLAMIGARVGDEEMKAYCSGVLARLGIDATDPVGPEQVSVKAYGAARATVVTGGAPYRVTTRDGLKPLDEDGFQLLLRDGAPALVAVVATQTVLNFGKSLNLAQKRVMFPLLLTFLRSPDDYFTMERLALEVWGEEELDASVQTKVKVAISRLRSLLGKARKYIVTTRAEIEGQSGTVVAYQLAPNLAFKIVEQV